MLKTKSIIKPVEKSDGFRISVMSLHTLNDGKTPDSRITEASYDVWMKVFSPPLTLIGDFYKRGLSFDEYKIRYLEYLRKEEVSLEVKELAKKAKKEVITIMCIEKDATECHRKILAEECQKYEKDLEVIHI